MSGVLRHLAGQALGDNKPVIHSMARMPYVAPPVLVQDTEVSLLETGHASPAPDTPRGVSHAVLHSSTQEVSGRIQVSTPGKADALVSSVIGQAPAAAQLFNRVSVSEGIAAEMDTPKAATPNPTTMTDTIQAEHTAQQVSATNLGELQQRRTLLPHHFPPAEIMLDSAEKITTWDPLSRQLVLPAEIMPDSAEKPALSTHQILVETSPSGMESLQSRPAIDPSHSDARLPPSRRIQESETTEVHVHIGRIEITAVHEAPTQKVKAAPVRKSMSLEEYLARRKGGQT